LLLRRAVAEELLLRGATAVHEAAKLPFVELRALRGEALANDVREREVHVVAAEEDVIADGLPLEDEGAPILADRDGRQIRRAAADGAGEHAVADAALRSPCAARRGEPCVERGLRLLDEMHGRKTCLRRGADGEIARGGVERRGDREVDVLRRE